ncbi:MAG: DMT family transporter [Bryobacteraceae bacterium]|nr:DMT family transporter [Bryobacteraceae bacterium]
MSQIHSPLPRSHAAELALALVCLIWGSTFVLVKNALGDISTILFLALRFSIATIVLFAVFRARGGRPTTAGLGAGLLTGAMLYTGYAFQTTGLRYTTPATSGFITGLYIVIVPILSAIVYRRMPRLAEWTGIAVASIGMGLLTLTPGRLAFGAGELLTLGCAVVFAVHILMLGHFAKRMSTDWLSFLQIAACAAIGLTTYWWVEPVVLRWTPALAGALAVTSLLATALAFWIQTWAQARTTPTRAALIFSLEPVFAWLASWLLQGEVLTLRAAAGAGCILAGILLVELKPVGTE